MAAYRLGVNTVIIPKENEPDLAEIDETVKHALRFVPVGDFREALSCALVPAEPSDEEKKNQSCLRLKHSVR